MKFFAGDATFSGPDEQFYISAVGTCSNFPPDVAVTSQALFPFHQRPIRRVFVVLSFPISLKMCHRTGHMFWKTFALQRSISVLACSVICLLSPVVWGGKLPGQETDITSALFSAEGGGGGGGGCDTP